MPPTVSVCIPTYNGEKYLKECLDSVLAQTFDNFEVLIVDDQSTDHTFKIVQEYAKQDGRIRIIQNPNNLGLVRNWNRCLELAQGDWIKFIFQDDLLAPQCLEKMLSCSSGKEFICCHRDFIFEDETPASIQSYYRSLPLLKNLFPSSNIVSASTFCSEMLKQVKLNIIGEPTSVMLHRSLFYQFGCFNANLVQLCDWEMWTRIASNTGFAYINESLATFRVHSSSTSSTNADKRWYCKDILDPLLMMHDFTLNPIYANLRTFTQGHSIPVNLTKTLSESAYIARRIAARQSANSSNHHHSFLREWNDVVDLYPVLLNLSKQNYVQTLVRYCSTRLNFMHQNLPWKTHELPISTN